MNKNPIQEERIRGYFIQAAMEILRGEGIRDLSVRNVAEKAGYSYATLYNYFKDLNALMTACINEFLNEAKVNIASSIQYIPKGKQRIAMINYTYIRYFVQYPGTFELIYSTKLDNMESQQLILSFLDEQCEEDWSYLIKEEIFTEDIVNMKREAIKYLATGMMLLYNNLRYPADYKTYQDIVQKQISSLLEI